MTYHVKVIACLSGICGDGSRLVDHGGGLVDALLGVDGGALVGHIGDVSIITVGGVGDTLDPTVGKSHGVGALDVAGAIGGLLSVELGLGVVIGHGVCVGVGEDLVRVDLGFVGWGGVIGGGGGVHGAGVGGGVPRAGHGGGDTGR